jgi:hypothetical protein
MPCSPLPQEVKRTKSAQSGPEGPHSGRAAGCRDLNPEPERSPTTQSDLRHRRVLMPDVDRLAILRPRYRSAMAEGTQRLAPKRGRVIAILAPGALTPAVLLVIGGAFLVGHRDKTASIPVFVLAGVLAAYGLWAAARVSLLIDNQSQSLIVVNQRKSFQLKASDIQLATSGTWTQYRARGRNSSYDCLVLNAKNSQVNKGRPLKIQASIASRTDSALVAALTSFCDRNGVQVDFSSLRPTLREERNPFP